MANPVFGTARATLLEHGWQLALTPAGAARAPEELPAGLEWLPAVVPGTAAQALANAGRFSLEAPTPLHDRDVWYRLQLTVADGEALEFDGLATLADVWLAGHHLLRSENMFHAHRVAVPQGVRGQVSLSVRFAALAPALAAKKGRARWRTRLAEPGTLRFVRTTLLGHMPGWCPPVHAVGPFRGVRKLPPSPFRLASHDVRAHLHGTEGLVRCTLRFEAPFQGPARLHVGEASAPLEVSASGLLTGELKLPNVERWWPHTHGTPSLYPVRVELPGERLDFGHTGFRTVEAPPEGQGFGLTVNGVPLFARGACWSAAALLSLADSPEAVDRFLLPARAAGMNLLRVGGTMADPGDAFFARCDALGLLVWQDFFFANFDYPIADSAFRQSVEREARSLVSRTQLSPSVAVFCGGSEVEQQAAMLGLPREAWRSPLFDTVLPEVVRSLRDDVAWVRNSPCGGDFPFQSDADVSHAYGVGAYLRPLDDARRANVRFAAECLAFANVPDAATLALLPGGAVPAVHQPTWKQRVPRDNGAAWDFEDTRDHYLAQLYRVDPAQLRADEPLRYLQLSRAVSAEVIFATLTEWRRAGSTCRGALVFLLQDLWPGAGFGLLDSTGRPKAALHGFSRASQPTAVFFSDEGLNGLHLHVANDGAAPLSGTLHLHLLREGHVPISRVEAKVELPPHHTRAFPAHALLPGFLDTTYAYRFGPPAYDVAVATLTSGDGAVVSQQLHWPLGRPSQPNPGATLAARVEGRVLHLACDRALHAVHIEDPHFRAAQDYFHLSPLHPVRVELLPTDSSGAAPDGEVSAISLPRPVRYRPEQTP